MIDHEAWQHVEQDRINQLDKLVVKLEKGSMIDLWEVAPELGLNKQKKTWSMLDPKNLRAGEQLSMPQIFLLPINPPQYAGFTFEKEYGKSPSWVAQLIKSHPDKVKPIITGQPIDYKPYPRYEEIFEASRKTYSGDLPPCTQWRVESLIAKYRIAVDPSFAEKYSKEYYRLANDYWASDIMRTLGLNRQIKPLSDEGRELRHFLSNSYNLACFGLSEIVDNVIHASSTIPKTSAAVRMQAAWRILDPYVEYLVNPLKNDLTGFSAKTTPPEEALSRLQLILPMIKNETALSKIKLRLSNRNKQSQEYVELAKKIEPMVPLEFILRLNSSVNECLFLPKLNNIAKSEVKYAVTEEGDQYSKTLYEVWSSLYEKGSFDKKALETLHQQSIQYAENIRELASKKLKKRILIEKVKISAGAFGSGFFAFYGLKNFSELTIIQMEAVSALLWLSETTFSFIETIKKFETYSILKRLPRQMCQEN